MATNRTRRRRPRATEFRDTILSDLKRALLDRPTPFQSADACDCDECRMARARDVNPEPRILQVQTPALERMYNLAAALPEPLEFAGRPNPRGIGWQGRLQNFCMSKFGKTPPLLREVEAAAIIAHLERGDIGEN